MIKITDYGVITQGYIEKGGDKFGLGNVQTESYKPTSDLDIFSFPLSGSKNTQAFDYSGVIRNIMITGIVTADTKAELFDDFIVKIDELQTGNQATVIYYSAMVDEATSWNTSAYNNGKFNIKVKSFTWDLTQGEYAICRYTLEMVESV